MLRAVSTIAALCIVAVCAAPLALATALNDDTAEKVAYCLGKAEQGKRERNFLLSLPGTPPAYPDVKAADDAKYRAETTLLRSYLADQHFTSAQSTPLEIVHAYNRGAEEVVTCIRDQVAPGSCNAECTKDSDTSNCSLKCQQPVSCTRPDPCPALERTLNP
ncbi:MAG TPA: hypothetical protein VGJ31_16170 [Dongiaceae bacterium]